KLSVAFGTCVLLGIILPVALTLAGRALRVGDLELHPLVIDSMLGVSILWYLAWFSLTVYGSTIAPNPVYAMIAALGIFAAMCTGAGLVNYVSGMPFNDVWMMTSLSVLLILLLNWLSFRNFRAVELNTARVWRQIIAIVVFLPISIYAMGLIHFLYFTPEF